MRIFWKQKNNNRESGFTLIEMMIVMAIIGILAAVGIPAYQSYIARAQASDGVTQLSGLKMQIGEYYGNEGFLPAYTDLNAHAAGSSSTAFLLSISDGPLGPGSGQFQATFKTGPGVSNMLAGRTITMTFIPADRSFVWSCTKLVPSVRPTVCK